MRLYFAWKKYPKLVEHFSQNPLTKLKPSEEHVLNALIRKIRYRSNSYSAHLKTSEIAFFAGYSDKSVQRALDLFETLGVIKKTRSREFLKIELTIGLFLEEKNDFKSSKSAFQIGQKVHAVSNNIIINNNINKTNTSAEVCLILEKLSSDQIKKLSQFDISASDLAKAKRVGEWSIENLVLSVENFLLDLKHGDLEKKIKTTPKNYFLGVIRGSSTSAARVYQIPSKLFIYGATAKEVEDTLKLIEEEKKATAEETQKSKMEKDSLILHEKILDEERQKYFNELGQEAQDKYKKLGQEKAKSEGLGYMKTIAMLYARDFAFMDKVKYDMK